MYVKYNAVLRGQDGGANKWNRAVSSDLMPSQVKSRQSSSSEEFSHLRDEFVALCKQNLYPTTLHAINSAVIKLGKLMKVQKVYRGLSGKSLPKQMLKKDQHNVSGGVEVPSQRNDATRVCVASVLVLPACCTDAFGQFPTHSSVVLRCPVQFAFMSTTTKKDVALHYATGSKSNRMMYEIQMGMVDRGADLKWLSQYEHEDEMCAAALRSL